MLSQIVAVFQYSSPFRGSSSTLPFQPCRCVQSLRRYSSGYLLFCLDRMFFPLIITLYFGCRPKYTVEIHFATASSKTQLEIILTQSICKSYTPLYLQSKKSQLILLLNLIVIDSCFSCCSFGTFAFCISTYIHVFEEKVRETVFCCVAGGFGKTFIGA